MRENRTYGSEGGEAKSLPYPYRRCWLRALCFCSTACAYSAASRVDVGGCTASGGS
jgi:hypothetical protein